MLFHGDQVKGGFAGFPWYGFTKKVMGWRMGAIPEPFDYALSGHFHTPTRMLIGDVTLWASGSPESDNTYAAERLAAQGTPSQWLLFSHPQRGVTAEYQVHLT
jgi:DNA repair exonuclease SbcCD nuclease subunit